MSREIVIVSRCDTCREPATQTFVVGIAPKEAQPDLHLIDTCDEHAEPLANMMQAISQAPPWSSPLKAPKQPINAGLGFKCNLCSVERASKRSLTDHVWTTHVGRPAPRANTTCPECNQEFSAPTAVGSHRLRVHGTDPLTEAYAVAAQA